jgi:hypothetical protein
VRRFKSYLYQLQLWFNCLEVTKMLAWRGVE